MDDIGVNGGAANTKLFTVLVSGAYAGGNSTAEGWICGVVNSPEDSNFLMNGIARQLAYNLPANIN